MCEAVQQSPVVRKGHLQEFASNLLCAAGTSIDDASVVAEALVWADLRARHPQGVHRLPNFIKRFKLGLINSPAALQWERVAHASEMLDAGHAFGHVAGKSAMLKAITLAKTQGVGVVTVKRSNLYGAASYFCSLATAAHCLGITATNAVSKVAPHGGARPLFGTNPIAFGCPTSSGFPILVDLSTSAIAGSSARSIDETGGRLPEGVALNRNGDPTTNPDDLAEGTLLPAAGAKGSGLALMVDILCGVLAGSAMGKEIGSMYATFDRPVNTGHFFLAIDIEKFQSMESFLARIDLLLQWMRESAPEGGQVRFPGEIRGEIAERYERDGIPLPEETAKPLTKLARALNVTLPWPASE